MPNDVGVEFLGVNEAAADFVKVGRKIATGAEAIAAQYAETTAQTTRNKVPVLSGNLMASVETLAVENGHSVGYDLYRAPYAGWIEFGGSHGREHLSTGRYLYPAFAMTENAYYNALLQGADTEVNRYPWHKP